MKKNQISWTWPLIGMLTFIVAAVTASGGSRALAAPPCGTPKGGPCPTSTPGGATPTPTPLPTATPAPTATPGGGGEPATGNFIYNGDFSNGLHRWSLNMDYSAMAYRSVVNGEYVFQIDDPGNETHSLMLERWGLDLVQGRQYAVYFDARALEGNRTIYAEASYRENPWTSYSGERQFNLTSTMQRFSYTFTMTQPTDWDGRIVFKFGTNASDVVMDNIAMYDLTGGAIPPEPPLPGPSISCNTLVWSDEFNGNAVNTANWTFETGGNGWGNQELQFYLPGNTTVSNGILTITAKKEFYRGRQYTSSRLVTQGKQSFQYGCFEMRADLPEGQGIWPAFWTLGENFATDGWPFSGEIDIMEMIGGGEMRDDTSYGVLHWARADGSHMWYGESHTIDPGNLGDGYHVFKMVWDAQGIYWFVDGQQFNYVNITGPDFTEFHAPHFLLINLAVGGIWPGYPDANTVFPQEYKIDYIRVYGP